MATPVWATAKEYALLCVLAQRSGEILSKTAIAELVWDINFDTDTNVVEVAIKRLRAKLDGPFENKLLHTIRGMGCVLENRALAGVGLRWACPCRPAWRECSPAPRW